MPTVAICDVIGRFYCIIDEKKEYLFPLDRLEEKILEENIQKNMSKYIMPVIMGGIEEYFRLFPEAICAVKLPLKELLEEKTSK